MVPGTSFADVVKINLAQKGHRKAGPLVGTQVASKSGEPLELFKEDTKLSYDTSHHANQRKPSLSHTLKSKKYASTASLCQNRFQSLTGSDSMNYDYETFDLKHLILCDTVTYDAEQSMALLRGQSTLNWDTFARALVRKKVDPMIINQA